MTQTTSPLFSRISRSSRSSASNPSRNLLNAFLCTPLVAATLIATPAMADSSDAVQAEYEDHASTEETVGFFSGAVIGALAGGPPGAILGAAIGAFAGDGQEARRHAREMQSELLTARIETDRLREETQRLQSQYQIAMAELDKLRSAPAQVLPAFLPGPTADACCDNTAMTVHFRSGSSVIESHYQDQLESIARLARHMPSASIEITGFADRNGDSDQNLQLSRQRSSAVQEFLLELGIDSASINTVAHGENRPLHAAQSLETDFFDRRAIVRIRDTRESMLTQTPDGD